jgi:hypothetical protein
MSHYPPVFWFMFLFSLFSFGSVNKGLVSDDCESGDA